MVRQRKSSTPKGQTNLENEDRTPPLETRRSGRARQKPAWLDDSYEELPATSVSPTIITPLRNPKRKATPEVLDMPEDPPEEQPDPKNNDKTHPLDVRRSESSRSRQEPARLDIDYEGLSPVSCSCSHTTTSLQNAKRKAASDVFDIPDDPLEAQPDPENNDRTHPLEIRRSGRTRQKPARADNNSEGMQPTSASPTTADVRQNPKRKAAPEVFDTPDDLLEASLGPWKENEQAEWPSWIELESDPAFFTAILAQIGVKGAKIEEVLSVEADALATLPEPVYGLVFLYEYVEEPDDGSADISEDLWFANQTTHNACATIALLNIIMNAEGLALGEKLRKFKQESMELSPPLRGNLITNSAWIRTAHNSFARRLDLLNAALSLQNEVDKKKRYKSKNSRGKATKAKAGRSAADSTYHFIAFVPVGRKVWQLDGLKTTPICIGEFAEGRHWTAVVCPVLEERMMRCGEEQLSFSLLALCGDDLSDLRRQLARNIRALEDLGRKISANPEWSASHPDAESDIICSSTDKAVAEYQLDAEDIQALSGSGLPSSEKGGSPAPEAEALEDLLALRSVLGDEQKRLRSEYEARLNFAGQGPSAILGRTKDHTAAIHEWVKKLAGHGVLRELHDQT